MKNYSDLFLLIRSIKPVELRYIMNYLTLKSNKKSDYILLFKAYRDPKNKNDREVKERFTDKKFYSSFETKKYYLYHTILKALHAYDYSKLENENYLSQIHVLVSRGFNEQALRLCMSSISKLEKKEEFELLLSLYGKAIDLKVKLEKDTNQLLIKKQECIKMLSQINDLNQVYIAVRSIIKRYTFIRSQKHLEELEDVMGQIRALKMEGLLSVRAALYYNDIYYQYFGSLSRWSQTKDYSKNKEVFLDQLKVPKDDVIRLNNDANIYLAAIENKDDQLEKEKRVLLIDYISSQKWNINNEHVIRFIFYILVGMNHKGNIDALKESIGEFTEFAEKLKDSDHENDRISLLFYFELSKTFFKIKDYDQASRWNYKVMYLADKNELCYDLFSFTAMFNMIIDYHRRQFKLWENHYDNAVRKIKKKGVYYDFEKLFMSFARKSLPDLASKNTEEKYKTFTKFKKEVDQEISKPFSKAVTNYFDFSEWAEEEANAYNINQL